MQGFAGKKVILILLLFCAVVVFTEHAEAEVVRSGDMIRIFGDQKVPEGTVIDGDVVTIVGNVDIMGRVDGDVVNVLGNLRINNEVTGDVVGVMSRVKLGPETDIHGELTVVGRALDRAETAVLRSGVQEINLGNALTRVRFGYVYPWPSGLRFLLSILFAAAVAVIIVSFFPKRVRFASRAIEGDFWRIIFTGFIGYVVALFAMFFLLLTLIGIPVSLLVPMFIFASNVFGFAALSLLVGERISRQASGLGDALLTRMLIGLIILKLAVGVPLFGSLLGAIIYCITFGTALVTRFGTGGPWFTRGDREASGG